jgi:hypothetical protein
MHTKDRGSVSEALILAKLLQLGKKVLLPFGDNRRYDLVIDEEDGTFTRVQCKTARISNGCVVFNGCSSNKRIKGRGYKGEADSFIAYCPPTDKYYSIRVDKCCEHRIRLRIEPPRNNQMVNVRHAVDYELK